MRSTRLYVALAAAGFMSLCLPARAQDKAVQANIPGVEWDELTKAIREIQSATKLDDAMAGYSRGCAQNAQSIKLQDTYMRRLLKFGRPDLAVVRATELSKLDAKNAVAWGTIAYIYAKRAQYLAALPNALKAVELEPDNIGICQDAAQLLVWYENGKRPPLNGDLAFTVKKLQSASTSGKMFAAAYKTAKDGWAKLDVDRVAKKKEADQANNDAKKAEDKYKQLSETLKGLERSYSQDLRRIDDTKRQLAQADEDAARSGDWNQRQNAERRRDGLARQLNTTQDNARKRLDDGRKARKEQKDLEKEYTDKRDHANRLLRLAAGDDDDLPSSFAWLPPAVDGVVTPDATLSAPKAQPRAAGKTVPTGSYLVPDKPGPKTVAEPPLDERMAEAEAADKLGLAKMSMDSSDASMKDNARKLIAEILAKYPKTKAAEEARELAKKLP